MQIGNANDFGSVDGIATSPCSYNRLIIVIEGPAHPAFAAERPRDDNYTVEALALNDEGQGADLRHLDGRRVNQAYRDPSSSWCAIVLQLY